MVSLCKYFYVKYFICTFNQQKDDNDKKKGGGGEGNIYTKGQHKAFHFTFGKYMGKERETGKERAREKLEERAREKLVD